jgi:hypothetical protein
MICMKISINNVLVEIDAERFDAGVRLGEALAQFHGSPCHHGMTCLV